MSPFARFLATRSCRGVLPLVERDHGWAVARGGEPIPGDAFRSAGGLCLSLAWWNDADPADRPLVRVVLASSSRSRPDVRCCHLCERQFGGAASGRRLAAG